MTPTQRKRIGIAEKAVLRAVGAWQRDFRAFPPRWDQWPETDRRLMESMDRLTLARTPTKRKRCTALLLNCSLTKDHRGECKPIKRKARP